MYTMVIFWLTLFPFLSLFNPPYMYQGNAPHLPKILQACYRLKNNMCPSITGSPFCVPENMVSQLHFNKIYVLKKKKKNATDNICVSLQITCWNPIPNIRVLRCRGLGRWFSPEGGAPWTGWVPLEEEKQGLHLLSVVWEHKRTAVCKPARAPAPHPGSA